MGNLGTQIKSMLGMKFGNFDASTKYLNSRYQSKTSTNTHIVQRMGYGSSTDKSCKWTDSGKLVAESFDPEVYGFQENDGRKLTDHTTGITYSCFSGEVGGMNVNTDNNKFNKISLGGFDIIDSNYNNVVDKSDHIVVKGEVSTIDKFLAHAEKEEKAKNEAASKIQKNAKDIKVVNQFGPEMSHSIVNCVLPDGTKVDRREVYGCIDNGKGGCYDVYTTIEVTSYSKDKGEQTVTITQDDPQFKKIDKLVPKLK